jgi:hypothetical protein
MLREANASRLMETTPRPALESVASVVYPVATEAIL